MCLHLEPRAFGMRSCLSLLGYRLGFSFFLILRRKGVSVHSLSAVGRSSCVCAYFYAVPFSLILKDLLYCFGWRALLPLNRLQTELACQKVLTLLSLLNVGRRGSGYGIPDLPSAFLSLLSGAVVPNLPRAVTL